MRAGALVLAAARTCHASHARRLSTASAGMRRTVAVGISGGVDSSVAALRLRDEGHDVIGLHMTNWDLAEEGEDACAEREARDAERVCERLGIGFQRVSFVREYWHEVFEPLLQGYHDGGTPNPDVSCNRHIKFDCFVKHALALGADTVATGHYARARRDARGLVQLCMAADRVKDQTYFLSYASRIPSPPPLDLPGARHCAASVFGAACLQVGAPVSIAGHHLSPGGPPEARGAPTCCSGWAAHS
jgi:hypothetical protein